MFRTLACAVAMTASLTTQAWSQNVFAQHDGTDEVASRGTTPLLHKGLYQRLVELGVDPPSPVRLRRGAARLRVHRMRRAVGQDLRVPGVG